MPTACSSSSAVDVLIGHCLSSSYGPFSLSRTRVCPVSPRTRPRLPTPETAHRHKKSYWVIFNSSMCFFRGMRFVSTREAVTSKMGLNLYHWKIQILISVNLTQFYQSISFSSSVDTQKRRLLETMTQTPTSACSLVPISHDGFFSDYSHSYHITLSRIKQTASASTTSGVYSTDNELQIFASSYWPVQF